MQLGRRQRRCLEAASTHSSVGLDHSNFLLPDSETLRQSNRMTVLQNITSKILS